jgi:hypothetical protein
MKLALAGALGFDAWRPFFVACSWSASLPIDRVYSRPDFCLFSILT